MVLGGVSVLDLEIVKLPEGRSEFPSIQDRADDRNWDPGQEEDNVAGNSHKDDGYDQSSDVVPSLCNQRHRDCDGGDHQDGFYSTSVP